MTNQNTVLTTINQSHLSVLIVAGYCVEGTLAKHILSDPTEITAMNGQKLPLNMPCHYISFSGNQARSVATIQPSQKFYGTL